MGVITTLFNRMGYQKIQPVANDFEKAKKEGLAQNPLATAYQTINNEFGIRRPSQITLQTLRRMSRSNWVDRTCIETLRDEVTAIPWDIVPVDPHGKVDTGFQKYIVELLHKPNRNKENWRYLIQTTVEDILTLDAGVIEKVRNGKGEVAELWHIDGGTIKPRYDVHGIADNPAYEQYMQDKMGLLSKKPVASWNNDDMIYIMWNPQGAIDNYGYGMSPVEAGLAVGTAFLYAEAYNMGFFRQNTIPPIIINMGKDVAAGEVDKFRSFLASEMMGTDGFHKPILGSFGEGFEIKELMKHPGDMAWEKYVEWQMRWKVALYRMNPQDIGFSLDQYKAEGQVQMQISKNKAIESLKGVLKDYINREILEDGGFKNHSNNLTFQWIDDEVIDPLDQADIDQKAIFSATKTVNEIRKRNGDDPVEGGDIPILVAGKSAVPLNSIEESAQADLEQKKNPPMLPGNNQQRSDNKAEKPASTQKSVKKNFTLDEGTITSLSQNTTAIAWMDDRGVTQPLFVTDYGKTHGFTIKPSFLDDRKEQEPPEEKVADILRVLSINTPEVRIMNEGEVLQFLPESLYPEWTKYLSLEAPYDSQTWRDRWGNTRQSGYYIVSGFINARDLGNEALQEQMKASPESYFDAVHDLARVWLSEMRFRLGDRKPGHYLITNDCNGFGVDYQFYQDEVSWEKTRHFLPQILKEIHPQLFEVFTNCVHEEAADFGGLEKAFSRPTPADWTRESTINDIERTLAVLFQKKLTTWYTKAVRVRNNRKTIRKAQSFDPNDSYITNGEYVFQNGQKYSLSVLQNKPTPSRNDLQASPSDYRDAFDFGAGKVRMAVAAEFPDITLRNSQLYAPMFEKRTNLIADTVNNTLKQTIDKVIVSGIDSGKTYGEIADDIQQALAVDPENPDIPGWRAERIARTESMWAINEGMRQQYTDIGIRQVNITPAGTACKLCLALASGNPYDAAEAEDLLPRHPSCRCVLTGVWDELLKTNQTVEKRWVTLRNGRHINIGGGTYGGGGSGGGHGGSSGVHTIQIGGISNKRADTLVMDTPKAEINTVRVHQYGKLIDSGHQIAPVVVERIPKELGESEKWKVVDGNHRYMAMVNRGEKFIPTIDAASITADRRIAYERATEADNRAIEALRN